MEIICPECQFGREVDETKIPAKSQVATCPKCKAKFKFRELPEEVIHEPQAAPETAPAAPVAEPTPEPAREAIVEPESSDAAPAQPEESDPTFAKIPTSNEGQKGLWDTLDEMAPPQEPEKKDEQPREAEQERPAAPVPPVAEPTQVEIPEVTPTAAPEQQPIPGWNGEFNNDFPDPYEVEDEPEAEAETPMVPPPFEQLDQYGFFRGLVLTVKLIVTSPRLFFAVMPVGGGLSKPLTFTILLAMIQTLAQYIWGMVGLTASTTPEATQSSGAMEPLLMLLFMPAIIAAGQFLITSMYHVLLILMRADHKGFEGTFRALAYANAPIVLGLFPMPLMEIEMAWMAIVAVWGLFLTVTGLKYIHKTSYAKVIPVAIVPLLLAMIGGIMLFQTQMVTI